MNNQGDFFSSYYIMVFQRKFVQNPIDTINFIKTVVYGRNGYSPEMNDILKEMENVPITNITIVRTPLSKVLKLALDALTFGRISKNSTKEGYDTLFHLALYLTTSKGVYSLEKNEVITMMKNPRIGEKSETMNVPVMNPLTTATLLNNTHKYMGNNFFVYDAKACNCQNFVSSILKANYLDTDDNLRFILQNTETIFKGITRFAKFGRTLTDIASRIDVIRQGGSLDFKYNGGAPSRGNGLTDSELVRLLRHDKKFVGKVYMKDELPAVLEKNKWYIINMENSYDGDGTHWVCFKTPLRKEPMIYFDPLIGGDPPIEVLEHARKTGVVFKMMEVENVNSTACGWYCVACILSDKGAGSPLIHFKRFMAHFSKDTERNELILHNLLVKLRAI